MSKLLIHRLSITKLLSIFLLSLGINFFNLSMAQELPIDVERTQKKAFPGGVDEDELQVLSSLPEYALKTDARSMQRQVYKNMYNEELKENRPNEAPEE